MNKDLGTMSSSSRKLSRLFNVVTQNQKSPVLISDQEAARRITACLVEKSSIGKLQSNLSLLFNLNSNVTRLVLSEPTLPTQSCIDFFKFLREFESNLKPDLTAVVTLSHRLYSNRRFSEMRSMLNSVVNDGFYERPVESLGSAMVDCDISEEKFEFLETFFDLVLRVYVDNGMFEEGLRVFDYMVKKGLSIDERSCIVFLVAAKKNRRIDLCLEIFRRMVDSGVKITVYSLTIVVEGLCRRGEVEKSKKLIKEFSGKGIKPEAYTYNTIINAYLKQRDFSGVEKILKVMKKDGVVYNKVTYTLLMELSVKNGKMNDVEKLFDEMRERGIESDIHVYTSLISWNCRKGNIKRAFLLFDELTEKGLSPSSHTYGALIDGVCKVGEMGAAEILMNEMQSKGVNITQVVFNTLINGYCRKGMIDEASMIYDVMEKKGFQADVFTCNTIASCFNRLKRYDEAKQWLFRMMEGGVRLSTVSYTNLIDVYCKEGNVEEAKRLFVEMSSKEVQPNAITYNVMIYAYCKQGKVKEARKLWANMKANGMDPDSYTYTSLIHGECIADNVDEAMRLFSEMGLKGLDQNSVTYTVMISGLSKAGKSDEAFGLYDEMKRKGYTIDNKVYTALIGSMHSSEEEMEFFTEYGDANRYRILEVIGKGSYGVVCAAIDTHTGEKVAIKKINDVFEHVSDALRILREVKLLRLLRHPDIVEIKSIMLPPSKREFKDIYVVFELMESDLHQVIKANDDLTREHHQFFLYQMLRALKYMHTANVYHRDLKPKNILANANCKLKVCDFGLARVSFNDTPTTVFWTDYVATRWYRAPELCGSFCSKYTPAIDIWSIGCIFAEVLTGKPLFPGKSVVHQLDLITDLLGTPKSETIAGVRNEKARKYLNEMRKKNPVPFSQKFPNADPLALRLLQRLLAFDPKDRPTAAEALADPYFKVLAKIEREPSCQPISKMEFEFERRRLTKDDIRELIYREILEYHPQLLKDYMNSEGSNFLYPSAIGHLRKQFAYLEENSGKSGPVIPPDRKHASLPRSTVHSSAVNSNAQPSLNASDSRRVSIEPSRNGVVPSTSAYSTKPIGPPPRVPSGRPGRIVESSVTYENDRNLKESSYDARTSYYRSTVLPPQTISPNCFFHPNTMNQEKRGGTEAASQPKPQFVPTQCNSAKPAELNPNPYVQSQHKVGIDAKLLHAQSQYGPAGAAAVAVAAHRNISAVGYGMS